MKTTTKTTHTPTLYQIGEVNGTNKRQWVVGKNNSASEIFYFDTPLDAVHKFMMLVGREKMFSIINSHEALLEIVKQLTDQIDKHFYSLPESNENDGKYWKRLYDKACEVIAKEEGS